MNKTSVYLSDADRARLRRLAAQSRSTYAEVLRAALAVYERSLTADRHFAVAGAARVPGVSARGVGKAALLEGFGDDTRR